MQRSGRVGGRVQLPELVCGPNRNRQVDRRRFEETGRDELFEGLPGRGESAGRIQEGPSAAIRRHIVAQAEGQQLQHPRSGLILEPNRNFTKN